MKIKSVVKVMNFHSLLRVDSSRKRAEKLSLYENELTEFVDNIVNNRNLILDKKILKMNSKGKEFNIFIANDLGFCGGFNANISSAIKNDNNSDKIIIGKKILKIGNPNDIILSITKEDYLKNTQKIDDLILDVLKKKKYSSINIIYNHYYNISKIELVKKKLYPLDDKILKIKGNKYTEDFVVEGNLNDILINIITLYLSYEIRVATENSYASENVQRQTVTKKSLNKIDEIEQEEKIINNKKKRIANNIKLLDNIIKIKNMES